MAYKAVAVAFKSRGGKGSRGVAWISHGPGEATVHLVEDGKAFCGISKKYKKSWRLTEEEANQGHARRWGWKLSVCKNCMTHLDDSPSGGQQKRHSNEIQKEPTKHRHEEARPDNTVDPPPDSAFSLKSTYYSVDTSHDYRQNCPNCGSRIGLHQAKRRAKNDIYTLLKCPSCESLWAHHSGYPEAEDADDWVSIPNEESLETKDTRKKINKATKDSQEMACFIATAAYGTPQAEEIDILRDFRDEVMARSLFGKQLISGYYTLSPPIAEWISRSSRRRAVTRKFVIEPLLVVSRKLLQ